jgi:flagella basal body P-ring formation protein FlgA
MKSISLAVLACVLGSVHAEAATLRTMTTLHAPVVRLSDLFDDAGKNADRVLGPGPGAGGRIVVEAPQLGAIAKQFGVDWRPASSADRAVLDRPGRPLPRDDVMHAVRNALVADGVAADCDIEMPGFTPPLVPFDAEARPIVSDLDYDSSDGRFSAVLSVAGNQMDPLYIRLAGHVDDTVELPVATARLPAGSVLRAEDMRMARVRASLVRGEVIRQADDAVGMQARRQIMPGQPLQVNELTRPAMVVKGATVLMQLDSPGIALTAEGQALEAGSTGDRIRVINPISRAVVEAEVIGANRVRVAPDSMPLSRPITPSVP